MLAGPLGEDFYPEVSLADLFLVFEFILLSGGFSFSLQVGVGCLQGFLFLFESALDDFSPDKQPLFEVPEGFVFDVDGSLFVEFTVGVQIELFEDGEEVVFLLFFFLVLFFLLLALFQLIPRLIINTLFEYFDEYFLCAGCVSKLLNALLKLTPLLTLTQMPLLVVLYLLMALPLHLDYPLVHLLLLVLLRILLIDIPHLHLADQLVPLKLLLIGSHLPLPIVIVNVNHPLLQIELCLPNLSLSRLVRI